MFSQGGHSQSRSTSPVLEPPTGIAVGFLNSPQIPELLTNSQDVNGGRKCAKVASQGRHRCPERRVGWRKAVNYTVLSAVGVPPNLGDNPEYLSSPPGDRSLLPQRQVGGEKPLSGAVLKLVAPRSPHRGGIELVQRPHTDTAVARQVLKVWKGWALISGVIGNSEDWAWSKHAQQWGLWET